MAIVTWPTVPDQNSWGYGKAFSKAKLVERQSELLPGNRLTIVCNLEIYYCDKQTDGKGPSADAPSTNDFKEQVRIRQKRGIYAKRQKWMYCIGLHSRAIPRKFLF